jgi:alkanesulfonate monooxygenase SsuD/methylene tetrahydromethanopterin reductase-like flavin-dependent oxidoreductase (luciferase family)
MRYGFYLPTRGPTATREGILVLAREGERLGLHSAMVADHIVFPVESRSTYPHTLDGKHPGGGDALETFSILDVVAGQPSGCGSSPRCWCCRTAIRC